MSTRRINESYPKLGRDFAARRSSAQTVTGAKASSAGSGEEGAPEARGEGGVRCPNTIPNDAHSAVARSVA